MGSRHSIRLSCAATSSSNGDLRCAGARAGISAAARRLGVSKSHISKQLALLETTLGAQLVQRTTRRFVLTELGQEYARHCHALVAVAQEADSMIAERRGKVSGVLHLGVGQSFGRLHVIPHLKAFQDRYPELELEVSLVRPQNQSGG